MVKCFYHHIYIDFLSDGSHFVISGNGCNPRWLTRWKLIKNGHQRSSVAKLEFWVFRSFPMFISFSPRVDSLLLCVKRSQNNLKNRPHTNKITLYESPKISITFVYLIFTCSKCACTSDWENSLLIDNFLPLYTSLKNSQYCWSWHGWRA